MNTIKIETLKGIGVYISDYRKQPGLSQDQLVFEWNFTELILVQLDEKRRI